MGTRHLTIVIRKEKPVVAQYGQWDGYPEGQGQTVLDFLKNSNITKFKKKLDNVRFMNKRDENSIKKFMTEIGASNGYMNMEQYNIYNKKYPFLSRDHGADILNMIYDSDKLDGKIVLRNHIDFASDSLFCEWAYLIDLDKNVLEVYEGFNTEPLDDDQRFKNMEVDNKGSGINQYYPIKCVKTYPLDNLPTNEEFIKELTPEDEKDEI